jgi:hypothetical protein
LANARLGIPVGHRSTSAKSPLHGKLTREANFRIRPGLALRESQKRGQFLQKSAGRNTVGPKTNATETSTDRSFRSKIEGTEKVVSTWSCRSIQKAYGAKRALPR